MDRITIIIVAAGALLAAAFGIYAAGKSAGKNETRVEAAKEAVERITDMEKSNANFRNLPARERCLALMRDSGLPADGCN